jgi:hypothetical protein
VLCLFGWYLQLLNLFLVLSGAALLALFPLHAVAAIAIAKANMPVLNEFFMLVYFFRFMINSIIMPMTVLSYHLITDIAG